MYAINLDFDPVTVGFDPREIKKNNDGTFTVNRTFCVVSKYNSFDNGDLFEAYSACQTYEMQVQVHCCEMMYSGRKEYSVGYKINDGEQKSYETRNFGNIVDWWHPMAPGQFNRKYGTNFDDEICTRAAFCVGYVNDHPNMVASKDVEKLFEEKKIIISGKFINPTAPEEDPFLPEAFKKMLVGTAE